MLFKQPGTIHAVCRLITDIQLLIVKVYGKSWKGLWYQQKSQE